MKFINILNIVISYIYIYIKILINLIKNLRLYNYCVE